MSKTVLFFLLLVVTTLYGLQAQDQRVLDSLENVVRGARNDVEKYNALHALAAHYIGAGNEKALQIVEEAEVVARRSGDTLCSFKVRRLRGQILFRLGRPEEGLAAVRPSLDDPNLVKYDNEHLGALHTVAICHLVMSKFDSCLKYQFQTLHLSKKVRDYEYVAYSLMNIGIIYYKLNSHKKALPFMLRSYELHDSLKIADFSPPMNISLCYTNLGDFDRSEEMLAKSREVCGPECPPAAKIHINFASAQLFFARNEFEEAERAFLASLKLSEQVKDYRLVLDNICSLARIYIRRNELATARIFLERGERVITAGAPFNMEKIKIFELLADLYLQLEDFKKTSFYQSEYIKLKDSVYNEAVTANLMKIESEFLERENQARIEKQRAVISDNEQTIERQAWLNMVVGFVSIMTIISTIFFYRSYRLKKDMNILLEARVRERTSAIELEVGGLMKGLKERELLMKRLMQAVGESVKSLKGMSSIARNDLRSPEMKVYVTKVDETIDRLERINGYVVVETE